MCNRSEDRAYGVDLGLQERTLETQPFPWSSVVSVMWYLICPETNSKSTGGSFHCRYGGRVPCDLRHH